MSNRTAAARGNLVMGVLPAATPAHAQFAGIVFDLRNYAQNILAAARTLQSVNQRIQQHQNGFSARICTTVSMRPRLLLRS